MIIDGNWLLKTDRKWLSFALSQIIDNALKYNKTGGKVAIELNGGISISIRELGFWQKTFLACLTRDLQVLMDENTKKRQDLDCI